MNNEVLAVIEKGLIEVNPDGEFELTQDAVNVIKNVKKFKAAYTEAEKVLREALTQEMEAKDIKKLDGDVLINYVAEYDRESLNSKKLREIYPDIYDEFINITPIKADVRIKVRDNG